MIKESAAGDLKKLKIITAIQDWKYENDGEFVPNWNDENEKKFNIYYSHDNYGGGRWATCDYTFGHGNFLVPYFSSQEKAQQLVRDL